MQDKDIAIYLLRILLAAPRAVLCSVAPFQTSGWVAGI